MADSKKLPRTIVLGHQAMCGKGTVASYLTAKYGYVQLNFATRLRETAVLVTGLPMRRFVEDKRLSNPEWSNKTGAQILQDIGSGMRNALDKDVWAKVVAGFVARSDMSVKFVVEDCRYPNEVQALQATRDVVFWRICRPDELRGDIGRPKDHESETALSGYDGWDATLWNDGTIADLQLKVERLLGGAP